MSLRPSGNLLMSGTPRPVLRTAPQMTAGAVGLIGLMALLMAGMGWLWAGPGGVLVALALAAIEALLLSSASAGTILRMLRAHPLPPLFAAELYTMAGALARRAGLPQTPRLFITPSPAIEAMAVTGAGSRWSGERESGDDPGSAIVVSAGALRTLTPREMAGVLAHETSHLAAGDIRLFRLVGGMATSVRALGLAGVAFTLILVLAGDETLAVEWFLVAFAAGPLLATLAETALWRLREYAADDGAVALTGDPLGLAEALRHIESLHGNPLWRLVRGLRYKAGPPAALRTHPRTRDRIARLLRQTAT